MFRRTIIRAFLAVSFSAILSLQVNSQTLPENPSDGFRDFIDKECVKCHAIWGEGEAIGPDLGKVSLGGSFLDLSGDIWNHFPYMHQRMGSLRFEWPKFSPEQLSRLVAFLYSLEFFDIPGNPEIGRVLFKEKGCQDCHSFEGKSGKKGPDLEKFKQDLSPIFMVQAMWNHVPEMSTLLGNSKNSWPTFQDNQMMDLLAFVHQRAKGVEREIPFLLLGSPKTGEKLFQQKGCTRCHVSGSKNLNLKRNPQRFHRSMTRIGAILWNSAPLMWKKGEVPKFSGQEMADIISYLYFLNYSDKAGDSKKGEKDFAEKMCADCHTSKGPAIDFSQLEGKYYATEMATEMLNHAPVMQKTVEEKKIPWPRFDPGELRDLFQYIGLKKQ